MKFKDFELDFSVYRPGDIRKYEAALLQIVEETGTSEETNWLQHVEKQCSAVNHFFDTLFWEGFHQELFGPEPDLEKCLDDFEAFAKTVEEQKAALNKRFQKYAPERSAVIQADESAS